MIGFTPGLYWRICWKFVAPVFLLLIIVNGLIGYEPLVFNDYVYPAWANKLGWTIAGSSVIMIPLVALIQILKVRGSLSHRLVVLTTPWRDRQGLSANGLNSSKASCRVPLQPTTTEAEEV